MRIIAIKLQYLKLKIVIILAMNASLMGKINVQNVRRLENFINHIVSVKLDIFRMERYSVHLRIARSVKFRILILNQLFLYPF